MYQTLKHFLLAILFICVIPFYGCGGKVAEAPVVQEETIYDAGMQLEPASFVNNVDIQLFVKKGGTESGYTPLENGSYVGSKNKTLGISVSPIENGQRVFVSDGDVLSIEAEQGDDGYYVVDFEFNSDAYNEYPLLIQVIYPDGGAAKKKYVLETDNSVRAKPGTLVKQGFTVALGEDILDGLKGKIEEMISEELGMKLTVKKFAPADNSTGDKNGVFQLDIKNLFKGDMVLNDTDTEGTRSIDITFEDEAYLSDTFLAFLDKFVGIFMKVANQEIKLNMGAVSMDLDESLKDLSNSGEAEDDMMASVLGNLELNKLLFVNAYGMPFYTTPEFAVLGGGLYAINKDEAEIDEEDEEGNYLFPDLEIDPTNTTMNNDLLEIDQPFNMGISLSQYNLNQMLCEMLKDLKIVLPASQLPIPFVIPEVSSDIKQELAVSLNPSGINIDFEYAADNNLARLDLMDVRMTYVENDVDMWELSLDVSIGLDIVVSLRDSEMFLYLNMTPIDEFCHSHAMMDYENLGIVMFDHTNFVEIIFKQLTTEMGGQEGDPISFSMPLSGLGLNPKNVNGDVGEVGFDGQGNCMLNLAVESIDTSGLCFIETLGIK